MSDDLPPSGSFVVGLCVGEMHDETRRLVEDAGYRTDVPSSADVDLVIATVRTVCEVPVVLVTRRSLATASARQDLLLRVGVGCRSGRSIRVRSLRLRNDLDLDLSTSTVRGTRGRVRLAAAEYLLLSRLLEGAGRVVRRDALVRAAWARRSPSTADLDSLVRRLRATLVRAHVPVVVTTVRGVGYRLDPVPM